MSIEDLVRAKQTQRNKDWLMVERLVEQLYFDVRDSPGPDDAEFVLRELRTPKVLIEAASRFPDTARGIAPDRPAIQAALDGDYEQIVIALREEQDEVGRQDRLWWEPLKRELEQFRHQK